jgi:flagellar basal-body rod protein FlgB
VPHRGVPMIDVTASAIHTALDGLAARQRVIADNVSNLETPGFSAGRIDFEDSLKAALADGAPGRAAVSSRRSTDAAGLNGNNVKVDDEVVSLTETTLRYQLMVGAMNSKFGLLRTAIGGGH